MMAKNAKDANNPINLPITLITVWLCLEMFVGTTWQILQQSDLMNHLKQPTKAHLRLFKGWDGSRLYAIVSWDYNEFKYNILNILSS